MGWAARSTDFLPECRLFFPVPEAHSQGHTERQPCLQVLVHPHSECHSWGLLDHDRQWRLNLSKGRKAFSFYIIRSSFTVPNLRTKPLQLPSCLCVYRNWLVKNSWINFKISMKWFCISWKKSMCEHFLRSSRVSESLNTRHPNKFPHPPML